MVKRIIMLQTESRFNSCNRFNFITSPVGPTHPPEIPGCNRAIGTPFFADLHQLFRRGQFSPSKSLGETFAHTVIIDRPDIRPAKIEQEKHLNCPAPDAAYLCEARDDFVIAHPKKCTPGWHSAIDRFCSEILYCSGFGARKTSGAEQIVWRCQDFFRIEPFSLGI